MEEKKPLRCAYCGTELTEDTVFYGQITYRMNKRVVTKTNPYCKGKYCCGYDQMGHEG